MSMLHFKDGTSKHEGLTFDYINLREYVIFQSVISSHESESMSRDGCDVDDVFVGDASKRRRDEKVNY